MVDKTEMKVQSEAEFSVRETGAIQPKSERNLAQRIIQQIDGKRIEAVKRIVLTIPGLQALASSIQPGQQLVLDISQETMRKLQSGELKLMKTGDDVFKAVICTPGGKIKQHLNVKYEQLGELSNTADLANSLQMANVSRQLAEISEQLEMMGVVLQEILQGQHNDRIALYYAGEQIYLEATKVKNEFLKMHLTSSALRSLEEAKTKMIESIKADIATLDAFDRKQIKLKSGDIQERIRRINQSFDVINRASMLKACIYHELNEVDAMFITLDNYASFLIDTLQTKQQLLYSYDKSDVRLDGKWHERVQQIPQTIQVMLDSHSGKHQLLEIDYETMQKVGLLNG